MRQRLIRQTRGLRPKQQHIARDKLDIGITRRRMRSERKHARIRQHIQRGVKIIMNTNIRQIVIIQTRPLEILILKVEPQRASEMQPRPGTRT